MGREDEIRVIAYQIWESEGCCGGRDMDHWFRAEVIWEERNKPKATVPPPGKAKVSPAKAAKPSQTKAAKTK